MIAWDFTIIKPNTELRLLDHFSICDCQTSLPCHDPVTTITDNFLLYLNNTRKPTERVSALRAPACPHDCRLILTCIERLGGCFCGDYYIHRWVILYIGCCWTYLMGLQSSLVNPPWGPRMFPLRTEVLHSSLPPVHRGSNGNRLEHEVVLELIMFCSLWWGGH